MMSMNQSKLNSFANPQLTTSNYDPMSNEHSNSVSNEKDVDELHIHNSDKQILSKSAHMPDPEY